MKEITIGKTKVGGNNPCFVVAEMSCNHFGNIFMMTALMHSAKNAGANAIKIQIDNPDGGITIDCDNKYFQTEWQGEKTTLYNLYRKTYTPWDWKDGIMDIVQKLGLEIIVACSCVAGVEEFKDVVSAFKVSSFEANDYQLIDKMMGTQKPIIISTGCSTKKEIGELKKYAGNYPMAFLDCVSEYPAKEELYTFDYDGISIHIISNLLPVIAVSKNAKIIEAHLTISRMLGGPDVAFSFEPHEFMIIIDSIRETENIIAPHFKEIKQQYRKSIFIVENIKKGDMFTHHNIAIIRPGNGAEPKRYDEVIGKIARNNIKKGTPMRVWMYK